MDQRGQGRGPMDPSRMPLVRRHRRPPSASCPGLQSGRLPADAGDARAHKGLVADEPEGKADRDWREGRRSRSLRFMRDGRGRHCEKSLRRRPAIGDGAPASAAHVDSITHSTVMRSLKLKAEMRLNDGKFGVFGPWRERGASRRPSQACRRRSILARNPNPLQFWPADFSPTQHSRAARHNPLPAAKACVVINR